MYSILCTFQVPRLYSRWFYFLFLCIVNCVIFCENSTNWSFFFFFFSFCCYLPLIDMNKQLQDIFISVSPSFFLCTCFLQIDEKKYTLKNKQWELKKRWIMSCWKKLLIAMKNFDNFLFTILFFFFYVILSV